MEQRNLFDTYELMSASKRKGSYDGPEVTLERAYRTANPIFVVEVGRHPEWLDRHKTDVKLLKRTDRAEWQKEWQKKAATFAEPTRGMTD